MCRSILLLLLSALSLGAQPAKDLSDLSWLAGGWGFKGKTVGFEEHWIAPAGGMMLAVSRTIRGGKVVEFEFLRIESRGDGLYYVAQPGGKPPVDFRLTRSTKDSAVFENPAHDNPKIISYRMERAELVATVEGDEGGQHKRQSFRFQKLAPAVK